MYNLKAYNIIQTTYLPKGKLEELLFWEHHTPKASISFRNDRDDFHYFLEGDLLSHKYIVTNNVKSYRNMLFFKDFHSNIGEMTVEFKDVRSDIPFPEKLLGLVRGSNFRPDVRSSQRTFELESNYYTSLYLYYTLFV